MSSVNDSIAAAQQSFLNKHGRKLNKRMYSYLNAYYLYMQKGIIYKRIGYKMGFQNQSDNYDILPALNEYLSENKDTLTIKDIGPDVPQDFLDYVYNKYKVDSCYRKGKPFIFSNYLNYLINNFTGITRSSLLAFAISYEKKFTSDVIIPFQNALKYISNEEQRKYVESILNSRVEGALAYDFSFTDAEGNIVKLSDFKDQVVVLDFWFTGCGNCRQLKPYMDTIEHKFRGSQAKLISICLDSSKSMFLAGLKSGEYATDATINVYSNGNGFKDIAVEKYQIEGCPTLIVINKQKWIVNVQIDP